MSALSKTYVLKLYVAGNTHRSVRAIQILQDILATEFDGVYSLKVIDVLENPQLAEEDKILATPTLTKILPPPVRKIIGDLSNRERVLIGLDLLEQSGPIETEIEGNTQSGSTSRSQFARQSDQLSDQLLDSSSDSDPSPLSHPGSIPEFADEPDNENRNE